MVGFLSVHPFPDDELLLLPFPHPQHAPCAAFPGIVVSRDSSENISGRLRLRRDPSRHALHDILFVTSPYPLHAMKQSTLTTNAAVAVAPELLPVLQNFPAIYELYHDAIFRYCRWKCRNLEDGQDIMQQTFMRFCVCLQRKQEVLHARAFLYRIAHNLIIDHARRKKEVSLDQLVETGFEPTVDTWQQTYSRLDAEKWVAKLNKMPKPYKEVLQYRLIKGLPPADIAKLMGVSSNTVSVRIYRGLRQLRA